VKIVLFDYDDTLVQSSDACYQMDRETVEALGWPVFDRNRYFEEWGKPHFEMLKALCPGQDIEQFKLEFPRHRSDYNIKLFPDTSSTLATLRNQGWRLGVISSKTHARLVENLKNWRLETFFEYVQGVDVSPYHKPDPRVFQNALRHFQVEPQEIIYIGDSPGDYLAARDAHLQFIGVLTGIYKAEDFYRIGCHLVFPFLSEVVWAMNKAQ
jgi:HAD superfamily hydrolase (TIGR01509 family)